MTSFQICCRISRGRVSRRDFEPTSLSGIGTGLGDGGSRQWYSTRKIYLDDRQRPVDIRICPAIASGAGFAVTEKIKGAIR